MRVKFGILIVLVVIFWPLQVFSQSVPRRVFNLVELGELRASVLERFGPPAASKKGSDVWKGKGPGTHISLFYWEDRVAIIQATYWGRPSWLKFRGVIFDSGAEIWGSP